MRIPFLVIFLSLAVSNILVRAQQPDTTLADNLYNKSKAFWYSNTDSGKYYLDQALKVSEEIKYKRGVAYALYGLGRIDPVLFKRFEYLTQSLAMFEELHDDMGISITIVSIGYLYDLLGEREKALEYYQRALEVKKKINDFGGIALALINIGIYHGYKGENDEALTIFREALVYRHKDGGKQGIAYAQLNIGETLRNLNQLDEARVWADSAITNFSTTNDLEGKVRSLHLLADIHKYKNEYDKSIEVYKKMIDVGTASPYNYHVLDARKSMVKYFEDKKDIQNAFAQQSIYTRIKDSLAANDYRVQTQKIANEFEFKKAQEAEDRKKEEENRKLARKNTLEYTGIAVIVFIVFASIVATRRKIVNNRVILLLSLLLLFEFLLVLTDPFVDGLTSGDPILKLLANIVLAILILPAHNFLEKFLQRRVFAK